MAVAMLGVAAPAAGAAPTAAPAVAAAKPAPDPDQLTAAEWREVKRNLDQSGAARAVTVADGTRTLTYTLESGTVLELQEPVGRQAGDVTTQVSAGGCGFLRLCVYFTPLEQRMIYGGAGAALGAAICAVTGPPGCVASAFIIGAAFVYINERGVCSYRLRVQVLPWVGAARCV